MQQREQIIQEQLDSAFPTPQARLSFEHLLAVEKLGPMMFQPLIFRQEPIGLVLGARVQGRQPFSEEERSDCSTPWPH